MYKVFSPRSKWLSLILGFFLIFSLVVSLAPGIVLADDGQKQFVSPYEKIITDESGRQITEAIFPLPPPKTKVAVATVPDVHIAGAINTLSNVPAFKWSYGCSATSAAMLFGYYDRTGYSNMYTGPTGGGVCPLDNSGWGSTIYTSVTCVECPLSATHEDIDGRVIKGHVDDYWIDYGDAGPDPYVGNWTEHTLGDCTGDYMGTNQSKFSNSDGGTRFYWYTNGDPLYDSTEYEPTYRDGCHGMRLFAESRGYTVTNFTQMIQGQGTDPSKGFTFADFQSEIDAGHPVLIQVTGHTMLGYGYNTTTGSIIYIHDTWDYDSHEMTWGGTYGEDNLQHRAVTVCSDTTPPAAVTDLRHVFSPTTSSMILNWTAPGDDGSTGTASTYDIKYSTSLITDANWSSASTCTGEPTPSVPGTTETFTVSGLSTGTIYYFAMKTSDEVPNESTLSNVISGQPLSAIPTLTQWGMISMAVLFCGSLVWTVRRRQTSVAG